jgi:hypothetical protein
MAWTEKQKKAASVRAKARWAKKHTSALPPSEIVPPAADPVSHPTHYTFGKYEVIDVLSDWFPTNPLLWQVGKYIARADHKNSMIEDLKKARFYLQREIERIENADAETRLQKGA